MLLIGADVGGTFTDIVLTDTEANRTLVKKVHSTPGDPANGVLEGITQACRAADVELKEIGHIYHGTTVATNAVLQHQGAVAGMITTAGFRDITHVGRHQRPKHYSLQQEIPWQAQTLVRRRFRKTVSERLAPPDGEVVTPLDEAQVLAAADELAAEGVESVAICFLFSYLNPAHELRAKELIENAHPQLFVSCSHEVSPQFREFERFTTSAMNAFVGPLVRDYVRELADGLKSQGFQGEVHIMRSNGGVAPAHTIAQLPVYTVMSGLAAGVLGGAWVGRLCERQNLITLDIGGTSADIGVVTDGRFSLASARDTSVAGYPIQVPMLDLHTIGAGGGSIAYVDAAGAFFVGPRSAGASPGPAAYDRGGSEPTVTDANIVLGRLDTQNFLGGAMPLRADLAEQAVSKLAESLATTTTEAAEGIVALLNANMANAIRARTVRKGIDPREYALVASGGAGPLHAVGVAQLLGIREVIVPPHPGINSAEGLLTTDLRYEVVKTAFVTSDSIDVAVVNEQLEDMESRLRSQLRDDGVDLSATRYQRSADARYVGQGYELRLPLPNAPLDSESVLSVFSEFNDLHQTEYGHDFAGSPIELVNLQVTAISEVPKIGAPQKPAGGSLDGALIRKDQTYFRRGQALESYETQFYLRERLPVGQVIDGPAVILQLDSTVVVPPGCSVVVHESGCLLIQVAEAKEG